MEPWPKVATPLKEVAGCGDTAIGHAHAWLPLRILR